VKYIIADDLTGALDTGVKLTKQGYRVEVAIGLTKNNKTTNMDQDIDALVIDTETRDLPTAKAKENITNFLDIFSFNDQDIIYKKIDSTMRGNIACEIGQIMNRLNKDVCIFTPALPANGRVVVGGYLLVGNQPLGISEYYNGELNQGQASYIPNLLNQQTDIPIGLVELKEVINGEKYILEEIERLYKRGKKIIVIDAVNEQDLKNIVQSCQELQESILYAGSAGLANCLFKPAVIKKESIKNTTDQQKGNFLIVAGTRNDILAKQIDYLKEKKSITDLKIDIGEVILDKEESIQKYLRRAVSGLSEVPYLVVRPDPLYQEKEYIDKLLKKQLTFRELEIRIRDFLSALSTALIVECQIDNLIVTGGDTAKGLCEVLGINSLLINDELLPGIPLSTPNSKKYNYLKLVTKAGGFGEFNTFYKLIKKLENYSL